MTTEEAATLRAQAEADILAILTRLQQATGLSLESLSCIQIVDCMREGSPVKIARHVRIDLTV
jgi:hypothetical protein